MLGILKRWWNKPADEVGAALDAAFESGKRIAIEECAQLCEERSGIEKQKANHSRARKDIALGQMYDQNADQAMLMAQDIRERSNAEVSGEPKRSVGESA